MFGRDMRFQKVENFDKIFTFQAEFFRLFKIVIQTQGVYSDRYWGVLNENKVKNNSPNTPTPLICFQSRQNKPKFEIFKKLFFNYAERA